MKDQKSLDEKITDYEKWDRARSIFIESLLHADHHLRSCAHNQQCYDELMEIRDDVINRTRNMINPRVPPADFGAKNDHVEPTTMTPNGEISNTLLNGALGEYFMSQSYKSSELDNPENASEYD